MTALRLTDGPPIPSTHVPRPVVYRAERVQVGRRLWWPDVPQACGECRGRLVEDDDRVVCVLCGREPYDVRDRRPAPLPAFDDRKPGPKGTPTLCADCGRGIHSSAKRCKWCNSQHQHRVQTWRAAMMKAGRRCTRDGCDAQVWGSKSGSLCKEHWKARERNRRAERAAVAS